MSRGRSVVLSLAIGALVALPVSGSAQSALEEVERLTRLGRTEEARAALEVWWEGDRDDAPRQDLQRGLWLRGRLTVDPVQAELDFQRLVVLYPSGPFTPDAILRLAQASWAMGDEEAARSWVEALERDYPGSDARERAVQWLASAGPLPPPGDNARRGAADRAAQVEAADPGPGRPGMSYSVQLGAFAETDRAVALHDSIRAEGVDARVVRVDGSRFIHVRVGLFGDRPAAVELLEELTRRGISAALVRDDRPETRIRD